MALAHGEFLFKVVAPIGSGGLGIVDEIEITESNCVHPVGARLARKRLGKQWQLYPAARERFEREISALVSMRHTNIITVQGFNLPGGERFYCMPKCEKSYRKVLADHGRGFEWTSVAKLGTIIASALYHAHALGFIHRDLKPENLLVDKSDHMYVADWGVGYFIHQQSVVLKLTQAGGLGTAYYCPLEQWGGRKADPRMDVYALGMTLAELAQGKQIAGMKIGRGIQGDTVDPTTVGAKAFNATLQGMTAMDINARISTMEDVIASLMHAVSMSETLDAAEFF
jgi:serine/threonine-protein kinase